MKERWREKTGRQIMRNSDGMTAPRLVSTEDPASPPSVHFWKLGTGLIAALMVAASLGMLATLYK
jgi:hypothetical protein